MIKLGTSDMAKAYVGSTEVSKVYLGSDLVYNKEQEVLPYDAEIEYLESTGTQYIDSGVECTGDLSVEIKFRCSTVKGGNLAGGIYSYGGNNYFRHHLSPDNSIIYWLMHSTSTTATIRFSFVLNSWHTLTIDATNGSYLYDNSNGSFTPVSSTQTTHANYGVFARLSGNMNTSVKTGNNDIAYLILSRNGVKLRHFIPVRVGQVGYMYDKVSGQLFGNAGTGSFILGPDV